MSDRCPIPYFLAEFRLNRQQTRFRTFELVKSLIPNIKNTDSDKLFESILAGDRYSLSRALTLVESTHPEHQSIAKSLISKSQAHSGKSLRIAISGSPGVGKSTIIESLGLFVIDKGYKPAILAIDPTSDISQGSILGDKTRMEQLSKNDTAFIRPSPTSGTLGGVANKTSEAILLCEAAGYDIIFIETVGVGQSETFAQKLSDIFILLVAPGTGDELQGIKRGIVELADIIVINKAEEDRKALSDASVKAFKNATHLAPMKKSGWPIKVIPCSALNKIGIQELWNLIKDHKKHIEGNNYLTSKRKEQNIFWAKSAIEQKFRSLLTENELIKKQFDSIIEQIQSGNISPDKAADLFLDKLIISTRND